MIRRILAPSSMALILVLAIPGQGLAATVSSNCQSLGIFRSTGRADFWQDHTHQGNIESFDYAQTQQLRHTYWGQRVGPQYATVVGLNLSSASAICIY